MVFVLNPEDIPRPEKYLRAGLMHPDNTRHFALRNGVVDSSSGTESAGPAAEQNDSVTIVDDDGAPESIIYTKPRRYIAGPETFPTFNAAVVKAARGAHGFLTVELEPEVHQSEPQLLEPADPLDLETARLVTIDGSVLLAGMDKSKFALGDGLFVSAALDLDFSLLFGTQTTIGGRTRIFTSYRSWNKSVPVPVDALVMRIFHRIADTGNLRKPPHSELDRTDLLCAATAIAYDAPLYTTHPELYAGLRNGLRVIAYGPVRNKPVVSERAAAQKPRPVPAFTELSESFYRGDELTPEIAARLNHTMPESDEVARFVAAVLDGADDPISQGWRDLVLERANLFWPAVRTSEQWHDDVMGSLAGLLGTLRDHGDQLELLNPLPQIETPEQVAARGEVASLGHTLFGALARWGNWPTDVSDDQLSELADDPDDRFLLNWFIATLMMASVGREAIAHAVAAVQDGEFVPSVETITEFLGSE